MNDPLQIYRTDRIQELRTVRGWLSDQIKAIDIDLAILAKPVSPSSRTTKALDQQRPGPGQQMELLEWDPQF